METSKWISALALAAALCCTACDNDDDNPQPAPTEADRRFMVNASFGNHAEVAAGMLADTVALSDSVSRFGEMMVTGHMGAQADLTVVARAVGVDIPQTPDSAHIAMTRRLATLRGYMFDTAYMNGQIIDHEKTILLYEAAIDSTSLPAVRAYFQKHLPAVRMHLDHARRIRAGLTELR